MKLRSLFFNKVSFLLLMVAAVIGGVIFWQHERRPTLEQLYQTQPLEIGDVTQTVSANGTLNPVVLVNVGTQVSGTVKRLLADFNDKVKKGQVLAELDDALFRAQARQSEANVVNAEANLALARANKKRMDDLSAKDYVSQQELEQAIQSLKVAEAQLALAEAQLQKDKTNLGYTVIRSPVSGVVVSREVDVGQTVAASFQTPTLFKIAQDLREMQINSNFAEADIGSIRVGQSVQFTVDAFPNRSFTGSVKQIRLSPTTQQNVVTYNVVVSVSNPDQVLMPGMTAYVNVIVAHKDQVPLVPTAALRFKPSAEVRSQERQKTGSKKNKETMTATVYVLDAAGLRAVSFVPGLSDNRRTEVVSGELKPGDRIVIGEPTRRGGGEQTRGNFRMRMF